MVSVVRGPGCSRRAVLRGAGVTLALPWLASLTSRTSGAQTPQPRLRFLPIYLPLGAPPLWKPALTGSNWALSSVLAPLASLKAKTTVISGLENGSAFNASGSSSVEPSHGRLSGGWLTCVDASKLREQNGWQDINGVSADQVIATHPALVGSTPLESLQVGLSSCKSSCDGQPCSHSRSVSWKTPTQPLYKLVDPKQVFDVLVGAPGGVSTDELAKARAAKRSVLDAILESANRVRTKLSAADQHKLDSYLSSVRSVEETIDAAHPPGTRSCNLPPRPVFPDIDLENETEGFRQNTLEYNKGAHADVMNDLIALAFECDATRIVSHMLEDERSEFSYDHVPRRTFTAQGSTPAAGVCGPYFSSSLGFIDEYATITWWNVGKVAELCQKLDQIDDGDGRTVLDNTVVFLGSCMDGRNHAANNLPALLVGGGGGKLKTDQHVDLGTRPLRDLYFTVMNGVFDLGVSDFGADLTGGGIALIDELLA
jgi:hypothetical protein